MDSKKIVILAGGWSGEREVSLNSGRVCSAALAELGHRVITLDPALELPRLIALAPEVDAALILLHGKYGEDGRVQGLLDCLGLPYPGAGVAESVISFDKILAKERYRLAGLDLARDMVLLKDQPVDERAILAAVGLPLVVKPAREGSTLGLSLVETAAHLGPALAQAFTWDDKLLIEEGLSGKELTAAVLDLPGRGETALPLIEIRPKKGRLFDYEAKYTPGASEEICPAPIDAALAGRVQAAGLAAHRALGLPHWSRTDMFATEDGRVVVLETNTIPGMAPTSLFPQAAKVHGLSLGRLLERLVELALHDRPRKK